jgi:outer membrane protein OmpA-like peptidoglycan-associated protein
MKQQIIIAASMVAVAASGLSGCANMSDEQKGVGTGAAIGAVAGAVLGNVTAGGNQGRSTATGAILGAAAGAAGGYLWSKRMAEQKAAMEQATKGTGVGVTQTPDNQLKLDIPSDISFDTGRYDIKPNFAPILDKFAASLTQHPVTTVKIIGHTDSTGSDAINNPLSVNRAASTRDYLVARGVAANRITIDGRGEREPIADNSTAEGRAKNRRVEIFVGEPAQVSQAPAQ